MSDKYHVYSSSYKKGIGNNAESQGQLPVGGVSWVKEDRNILFSVPVTEEEQETTVSLLYASAWK